MGEFLLLGFSVAARPGLDLNSQIAQGGGRIGRAARGTSFRGAEHHKMHGVEDLVRQ